MPLYDEFLPSVQNFIHKLRVHLLSRLLGKGLDGDDPCLFTDEDRNSVRIVNNTMFSAKQLSVNYTIYDVRRDRDTINTNTHPYVMLRSPEVGGTHPYWYAQVLGIYHAHVSTTHPAAPKHSAQRVEFLWVRWLGIEPGYQSGSKAARLPKVGFVEDTDVDAFGFLDPDLIIRGSHLIPDFNSGRTRDLMSYDGHTVARPPDEKDDWMNLYVNMYGDLPIELQPQFSRYYSFVDRDMFVRYLGGGIGHLEQFPPSDSHGDATADGGGDAEAEADDFATARNTGSNDDNEGGEGGEDSEDTEDGDDDDESVEDEEAEEDDDLFDEEMGNAY